MCPASDQQHSTPDTLEVDADEYDSPMTELETAGTETERDISGIADLDFRSVVLAPSDWTVGTLLNQLEQGSFNLDPDFQRRNAWTDLRKSKFIESLMIGLPIPQLTFAEREDEHGDPAYIVIDGKQRLLAIEAFFSAGRPLRLSGLNVLTTLNGMTLEDVKQDPTASRYVRRLSNRTIRTVVIRSWPNESFLHLVFHRINHQTLQLSAQELRQALTPGPFTTFADKFAGDSVELHRILGASQQPDFRMRDVELLVRFLAFKLRVTEYKGNLKRFLDETSELFNREWTRQQGRITEEAGNGIQAILATERIFGVHAFRRYDGDWETRFNRAVYDAMTYYFSDPAVAGVAVVSAPAVVEAFKRVSTESKDFADAVRSTTKTVRATAQRLELWGKSLGEALDLSLPIPVLAGDGRTIVLDTSS